MKNSVDKQDNRLRILYLYQMLLKYTDENHMLSVPEILQRMEREHGIIVYRTTLPRDIEVLRAAGIEVMSQRNRTMNYYLPERAFPIPELRLLIDAVQSSKFITESKSRQLIEKLTALTSETNVDKLERAIHVTGKAKSDNEKGYYIVDAINEAIHSRHKITFFYFDYGNDKAHVRRNDGKPYTVSPYDLIWDGDFYYMTGFCDERNEVRTFRVDRIEMQPTVLEDVAVKAPPEYRIDRYTKEVFRMFATQETTPVTLLCEVSVMKAVIDKFGIAVDTTEVDDSHFIASVNVCISPTFYRWVFGWDGLITIQGPEEVKKNYKKMLQKELQRY